MIPFSELYDVSLDYIYRGDMSNLPDGTSQRIRAVVAQDPRFVTPHPTGSDRVRLVSRWITDQGHRLRYHSVEGGVPRDQYGFGVQFPYSPIGRTRWELANANLDSPFWMAHFTILKNREGFRNFSFNLKTRSGRWMRLTTSGEPHFENGCFLGYQGTGRFFGLSHESERAA